MTDTEARAALQRLIEERREDYAGLSRLLGRNPAYVQQYIRRGTPRRLGEEDRRTLARYFGVAEERLGGPAPQPGGPRMVRVPRLGVGASAGAGAFGEDERAQGHVAFHSSWLRRLATGTAADLSMIGVEGDSMAPTLMHGDDIMVDRADRAERLRDGIYVLRMDGALLVKRVARNPARPTVSIRSDNEAYPGWPDCDPAGIDIVGRVVWAGRRIG